VSTAPVVEAPVAVVDAVDAVPAPAATAADDTAAAAPPPAAGAGEKKAKKKRDNNPGVRVQGGRIYDSEKGTTCHQVWGGGVECEREREADAGVCGRRAGGRGADANPHAFDF
jgi:hypothetical protein